MKKIILALILLVSVYQAFAVSNPVDYNGRTYYAVSSLDVTEDSGDKVCSKLGMNCAGYTETSTAVCRQFHPSAAESYGFSGDQSGVYCDGSPQSGVCSGLTDTCHSCPECSAGVECSQVISSLYREMYVECTDASIDKPCQISFSGASVSDFLAQIEGIDSQLKQCPQPIPAGTGLVFSDGNTVVHILMDSTTTESVTVAISNSIVTGINMGSGTCTQKITVSESDINSIVSSSDPVQAVSYLIAQKQIIVQGCNFKTKAKLFFLNPIAAFIAKRAAPSLPEAAVGPDCGQTGESCNNRACLSGICAAPKEFVDGQWKHVNYRCIDQSDWDSYCQAQGNAPPQWHCITGPCS